MKKVLLECFYTVDKLPINKKIAAEVLSLIDASKSESYDYGTYDNVGKLDWSQARNFDRPWVKVLLPILQDYFNWLSNQVGYGRAVIEELWFQQYTQGNTHGWHTHGSNFSGVYYLEFPEGAPTTELVEPYNQTNRFMPDVVEGDVIVFPAFTLHKAPVIKTSLRKTIVSFNVVFVDTNPLLLKNLK